MFFSISFDQYLSTIWVITFDRLVATSLFVMEYVAECIDLFTTFVSIFTVYSDIFECLDLVLIGLF